MLFPSSKPVACFQRVVITGAGIITAYGRGWDANRDGFRVGRPAFRPIRLFDVSKHRVKVAAEIDENLELPSSRLSAQEAGRLDRAGKLLLIAADEAWKSSGWTPANPLPVVLGTTSGGMSLGEAYYRQAVASGLRGKKQASRVTYYQAQRQALALENAFGFSGPITIIANACAAGANAIGHAWELIRNAQYERVLAGGYDALSELVFTGFDVLQALSPTQCRPFDANRDGLALGEGAAILALESLDSARKRGASVLAEIVGYGASTDAHHLTQPHPGGEAAIASMKAACASAGLEPRHIDYINAHGTATPLNDAAEAAAINAWARDAVARIPVSSTKSGIGHLLGGAGAVETAVCVMALQGQWLPPSPTVETPDKAIRFPLVRQPREGKIGHALTNSFGFGGANATLILKQWN